VYLPISRFGMIFEYSYGIKIVEMEFAELFLKKITVLEKIILFVERLRIF
jgi:hypothetical protein